ncbi:bifunctional diguanylate cyclase/phosphodiesterase [Desulfurivibrio dismutans]|uniref:bifunctional diguanylate cyclase/phosphodiesterase n=1 Tax=Desulfurivibrio dismutans TaxID=1398908 RepID=UPI0023DC0A13|nr:EAL domain-containing protein [Desulfurivibrio alkaliphilus]MDF1615526.1 EAL domain-containing protein [Desulfurivibrio alkaliphilus]
MSVARFKTWILTPMAIAILLGLVFWGFFQYQLAKSQSRASMSRLMEQGRDYRTHLLSQQTRILQAHAKHLSRNLELTAAWGRRDRELLLHLTAPLAAAMLEDFKITHFYLVEPDRSVFLRPYNPSKTGGTINRHTMLQAATTGQAAHGLELGSSATLTLRYVIPWYDGDELLGFIELGMETEHLLQEMANILQVQMVSVLRKEYTSQENFTAGREKFAFSGNWDDYPDLVIAHQTASRLPAGLQKWLRTGHNDFDGPAKLFLPHRNERLWGGIIHQHDAAGRDVADLVILYDATALMGAFRQTVIANLAMAAILLGALLTLLYTVTRKAEREVTQAMEQLRHQATHDRLTGLPNRELFQDRLRQAVHRAAKEERPVAVLQLDLDNFKAINNNFGHAAGDEVLRVIARRLQETLADGDGTVGRFSGDEFVILLPNIKECRESAEVARQLLAALETPVHTDSTPNILISGSTGIACFPDDGDDDKTLLRHVEMAMYQAKKAGRGTYSFYARELNRRHQDDLVLHHKLKTALEQNRLELHYQPKVAVADGRIIGVEALLRWHDEELGQVGPDRFIPMAEATGLIVPLGDWVLHTACRQLADWHAAGRELKMAVNLSPQQFRQPDLVNRLANILAATGAPAHRLELEITETAAMDNINAASRQLHSLSELGLSLALDDFGTGHSSLAYLKSLPISQLKIDRSFISDLTLDESNRIIVKAVLGLAASMNLEAVAEGVESEEQLEFLHRHHCTSYQGWIFARALPAGQLEALLNHHGKFT